MPRYIDAELIKRELDGIGNVHGGIIAAIKSIIDDIPTAKVEEVSHGEWVRDADLIDEDVWVRWSCSECGYVRTRGWEDTNAGTKPWAKLCENCGAKMDEKENSDGET